MMASDIATTIEGDSRRKHRRSPDEEAEESSKRRKHRHHHRSRHHRHHRKSKKHEDDENEEEEVQRGEGDAAADPMVPAPSSLDRVSAVLEADLKLDDDMEEGEIVDDADGRIESADINLGVDAKGVSSYIDSGHVTNQPLEINGRESGGISKMIEEQPSNVEFHNRSVAEKKDGIKFRIGKSNHGSSPKTFIREPYKKCNTLTHSFEDGSGNEKADSRRKSLSHDSVDKKPRSKSIDKQVAPREHSHASMDADMEVRQSAKLQNSVVGVGKYDTGFNRLTARSPNGRKREADGDRGSEKDRDKRWDRDGERNRVREKDMQRRVSGGDREKREVDRDQDSEKEPDGSMCTDTRKDRDRETGIDRENEIHRRSVGSDGGRRAADWDKKKDKEQERTRDRDRETSRDSKKALERRDREKEQGNDRDVVKERDRSKERHISHEHIRVKERGRGKENEVDLDRRKVNERERRNRDIVIDSDTQRASRRDRSRDRVRERDQERERGRDRYRGLSRAREKDSERDRNRGKDREDRDSYTNYRYGETEDHYDRTRRNNPEKPHNSKIDSVKEADEKWRRDEDEQEDYQERISLQLADREEEDIEKIKEESRRIRQAILEKYKSKQIQQQTTPPSCTASKDEPIVQKTDQLTSDDTATPAGNSGGDTYVGDSSFSVGKFPQNELSIPERTSGAGGRGLGEGTPKSEMSNDMFCDDIFGDSPAGVRKMAKGDGLPAENSGFHDNWDDAEGYYSYRFGEILDGRYEITAAHGKGVFSNVIRAKDLKDGNSEPEDVAIKIIRNNETMYKSGQSELIILKKLVGADPEDRRHCVRFLSSFKYRNHLCLVFESLHMNLREVLKKFGRNIGLKLTAVRAYAKQLFIALKHLKNCGVLHCDIKPDNMLVNDAKNVLKLCDFGSAMFAGKNEITPYLVSRFYRAPEIILGLPYDHPLDMWSVGCCLYELYTGKVLFPGSTNSDMLRLHMELKGPFPKKMLRKGGFLEQHFDQDLNFLATEEDPVTKKTVRRMMNNIKAKDIGTIITSSLGEDPKMVVNFKDLLDKMFVLDPDKRLTVAQALSHPFITGK